jgi:hypothetical protein
VPHAVLQVRRHADHQRPSSCNSTPNLLTACGSTVIGFPSTQPRPPTDISNRPKLLFMISTVKHCVKRYRRK